MHTRPRSNGNNGYVALSPRDLFAAPRRTMNKRCARAMAAVNCARQQTEDGKDGAQLVLPTCLYESLMHNHFRYKVPTSCFKLRNVTS